MWYANASDFNNGWAWLPPTTKSTHSVGAHEPMATKYFLCELNIAYYSKDSSEFARTQIRANNLDPCLSFYLQGTFVVCRQEMKTLGGGYNDNLKLFSVDKK
jgi:hypothetical protein